MFYDVKLGKVDIARGAMWFAAICGAVMILSGVMMLEYLGWHEAAKAIVQGLESAIINKTVTYDFARQMAGARKVKCSEFGDEIIKHLG